MPEFNLTSRDRHILSLSDGQFKPHSWADLRSIIARNDLSALARHPSDLKRYIAWTNAIKAEYGSITAYICRHRLRWTSGPVPAPADPILAYKNPVPFADPEDYRILRNDWPYGIEPGIEHLVIWLRTPIAVTEDGVGDMTEESRLLIQDFIDRTFVRRLAEEGFTDPASRVLWFKNWTALQSVRALEHVHVLLKGVPERLLFEWTGEKAAPLQRT